ncbi:MAG: Hsp20/alpha crystallin family protein [bacterium]|nr:Hsp20/alpha crystallin family protein [bacterium]
MSLLKNFRKELGIDAFSKEDDSQESSVKKITFETNDENDENNDLDEEETKEISEEEEKEKTAKKTSKKEVAKKEENSKKIKMKLTGENKKSFFGPSGQLAIDLSQNDEDFVIQATLAGINVEDLDILIEDDLVVIKGERQKPEFKKSEYEYIIQECFWGSFSREIILPEEIKIDDVEATMETGILTIKLPKLKRQKKKRVMIKLKN